MGYFDEKKNVEEYISMAEGYEGKALIQILKKYLPRGSAVLELGMGPGKDLDLMKSFFKATGSDLSDIFLDLYRKNNPGADILKLDAVSLKTDRIFDSVYSNKVLHHIPEDQLIQSLMRQKVITSENGILLHSFWKGKKRSEVFSGLYFYYYEPDDMNAIAEKYFEVIETSVYSEMEDNDSFYILMKNSKK